MKHPLHIVNGDSAAGIIRQAIKPETGNLLVNIDPISCGPLPAFTRLEDWTRVRQKFIGDIYAPDPDFKFLEYEHDILRNCEKLKKAEEVYLWMGSGLAEQLLCVWIIRLFKVIAADIEKIKLIQFLKSADGRHEIVSIGLLNPEQLANHPLPRSVAPIEVEYLDAAWKVLSGSDPFKLIAMTEDSDGPMPHLRTALRFLVGRFPHHKTGLTHFDTELLYATSINGPGAARIIGHTIVRNTDSLDQVGDRYLYHRLCKMGDASARHPLVELKGRRSKIRGTDVFLTETGNDVLTEKFNNVTLNGIDDWIGGIHLCSDNSDVWYRKNGNIIAG